MLLTVIKMPPVFCVSYLSTNQHTVTTVEVQTTSDWSNISLNIQKVSDHFLLWSKVIW